MFFPSRNIFFISLRFFLLIFGVAVTFFSLENFFFISLRIFLLIFGVEAVTFYHFFLREIFFLFL